MNSFVTYAQNFEDLMLWRALHTVNEGFYIDAGAADPDEDSVTRAFYDRGWRGINIEPAPEHFEALLAARPRDITLRCLLGASSGESELHHFYDTGLSTTDGDLAARHVSQGRGEDVISLPVLSLADVCRRHAPDTIHFLKIDVEGAEVEVLRGADFGVFRPWIILVEATEPGSQNENWSQWDGLLIAGDYRFVWFDGLNRFYIAGEHWDALRHAFTRPPNVFDQWIQPRGKQQRALLERGEVSTKAALSAASAAYSSMMAAQAETANLHSRLTNSLQAAQLAENELAGVRSRLQSLETAAASVHAELATVRTDAAGLQGEVSRLNAVIVVDRSEMARLHALLTAEHSEVARLQTILDGQILARQHAEARLAAVYRSRSWRAAAPLRAMGSFLHGQSLTRRLKRIARGGVYSLGRLIMGMPGSRVASGVLRRRLPTVHAWLYARCSAHKATRQLVSSETNHDAEDFGEHAALDAISPDVHVGISAEESRIMMRLRSRNGLL